MAIQGRIDFKGISLDAYIKATIGSISEVKDDKGVKTFVLNYNYEFRATKQSEIFYTWSDSCAYDLGINAYEVAYNDLAVKLKLESKEI
jgi:hypothetical protein